MSPNQVIQGALAGRRSTFSGAEFPEAYRLVNGPGDSAPPGLALDWYRDRAVIIARDHVPHGEIDDFCEAAAEVLAPKGLVVKVVPKAGNVESRWVMGDPSGFEVREGRAVFGIELGEGLATGLYLDHRETRLRVHEYVQGDTLNLFAYTGSFSVHAALAGSSRVVSVDASKRALKRARENFQRSGLDPGPHGFVEADVIEYLGRAYRKGWRFGLVILDPPAFGRAGKKTMSLDRDLEELIEGSISVLAAGGVLMTSVHALSLGTERILAAIRGSHRRFSVLGVHGLSAWDFPVTNDDDPLDRGEYLKVVEVRVE